MNISSDWFRKSLRRVSDGTMSSSNGHLAAKYCFQALMRHIFQKIDVVIEGLSIKLLDTACLRLALLSFLEKKYVDKIMEKKNTGKLSNASLRESIEHRCRSVRFKADFVPTCSRVLHNIFDDICTEASLYCLGCKRVQVKAEDIKEGQDIWNKKNRLNSTVSSDDLTQTRVSKGVLQKTARDAGASRMSSEVYAFLRQRFCDEVFLLGAMACWVCEVDSKKTVTENHLDIAVELLRGQPLEPDGVEDELMIPFTSVSVNRILRIDEACGKTRISSGVVDRVKKIAAQTVNSLLKGSVKLLAFTKKETLRLETLKFYEEQISEALTRQRVFGGFREHGSL